MGFQSAHSVMVCAWLNCLMCCHYAIEQSFLSLVLETVTKATGMGMDQEDATAVLTALLGVCCSAGTDYSRLAVVVRQMTGYSSLFCLLFPGRTPAKQQVQGDALYAAAQQSQLHANRYKEIRNDYDRLLFK